jgi:murein L,D-transpeptidase YafK
LILSEKEALYRPLFILWKVTATASFVYNTYVMFYRSYFLISLILTSLIYSSSCEGSIHQPADGETTLMRSIDSIWVVKHTRKMYVFHKKQLVRAYKISLGTCPVGAKRFEGDRKTPEGLYYINEKNPASIAYKSIGISYPNKNDRRLASGFGRKPGGLIKIHGTYNSWRKRENELRGIDWTWGCIAVFNKDMDEIYEHVSVGTPILIEP